MIKFKEYLRLAVEPTYHDVFNLAVVTLQDRRMLQAAYKDNPWKKEKKNSSPWKTSQLEVERD